MDKASSPSSTACLSSLCECGLAMSKRQRALRPICIASGAPLALTCTCTMASVTKCAALGTLAAKDVVQRRSAPAAEDAESCLPVRMAIPPCARPRVTNKHTVTGTRFRTVYLSGRTRHSIRPASPVRPACAVCCICARSVPRTLPACFSCTHICATLVPCAASLCHPVQ
jgi:hypothetical protein